MTDKQYTVLTHSNASWVGTGYGNQMRVFVPLLHAAGWRVIESAYYGLQGAPLNTPHSTVLPTGLDQWGNDVLPLHYQYYKPDVMFHLHDIWVLQADVLRQYPASSWCPVDHSPIPPAVLNGLRSCRWPIAMSKFGEKEMRKVGLDPLYIPHGINTDVFKPMDRTEARQKWGVPEDVFFAVVVAANKGNPSRKSLDRILKAWAKFTESHPNALLYMHSLPIEAHGGWNLINLAASYGVDPDTFRLPDTYRYVMGKYTWDMLAQLYNAADVKIGCSMGEGFGITEIEAQACGCPVIVTDFSAQSELCFGGYKIPVDEYDGLLWTYQDSEQAIVAPSEIEKALNWAWEQRGNEALRQQAREGAMLYDSCRVFERHMNPIMHYMADVNRAEQGMVIEAVEPPAETAQEAA